jgi:phosphatidylglycerol lysyltransferase
MSLAAARELVMAYGWNATAYQILNPGIEHWFSPEAPGVVGYTRRAKVMLVAGEPACAHEVLAEVACAFEDFARSNGCRVCYVCAAERMRELLAGSPRHAAVTIGAQPVWDPRRWSDAVKSHPSLRAQLNRSRNKGVVIEPLDPEQARDNAELQSVLREWLDGRTLPPLHFLTEPVTLAGEVRDRILLVARREGRMAAFLVASPIGARRGYLIEQVARARSAPNGTAELLIDNAMRRFADGGGSYVSLGLVALATRADVELAKNPAWLRAMMRLARAHANRFYNFRGLEQFRAKMLPERWEPVYAISNERRFSMRTLYAIGEAFAGMPPWMAIGIGAAKAARDELRGFARKVSFAMRKGMARAQTASTR